MKREEVSVVKKAYEAPALEVICFEAEDVITTSTPKNPGGNEGEGIGL